MQRMKLCVTDSSFKKHETLYVMLRSHEERRTFAGPEYSYGVATISRLVKYVSFAQEPYKRGYILQRRPMILRSLLIVATPYQNVPRIEQILLQM